MMDISVLYRTAGLRKAADTVAAIDIFGDLTLAVCLMAANANRVILCESMDAACAVHHNHPDPAVVWERGSFPEPDEVDLAGKTAVLVSDMAAALKATAIKTDMIVGGLVNAKAVAAYLAQRKPDAVSLVCMGDESTKKTMADKLCAEYIRGMLERRPLRNVHHMVAQLKYTDGALFFDPAAQDRYPETQFYLRTAQDQYDFVLRATCVDDAVVLDRIHVTYVDAPVVFTQVDPGDMLSGFSRQEVLDLPWDIKGKLSYGDYRDPEGSFDAAMILGGNPTVLESRAAAAAKLYHEGRCQLLIPTGGVKWETEFGYLSECDAIARYLMKMGVPKTAISGEAQSDTTKMNMQCVRVLLEERMDISKARIAVVTSYYHVRRSVLLAQHYIPEAKHFGVKAEFPGDDPASFREDPRLQAAITMECICMWSNIHQGMTEDICLL